MQDYRNPIIEKANDLMKDYLQESMVEVVRAMGSEDGIYYHGEIIKAIEDRDKKKVMKLMKEHIDNNFNYI